MPLAARERLGIEPGDRPIVDVQDGVRILLPEPRDHLWHTEGLHREIRDGVGADAPVRGER